ncbi:MAG TPA: amidohydrolase family protein [Candidatus Limnocylindrales bacterium]|nr:amidohydrolase family protein [Candidatus Limnocylindrales bacterium]
MALDLSATPILDHHCHSLLRGGIGGGTEYARFFTESGHAEMRARHASQTIFFRWGLKALAGYFGCAPTAEAVVEARSSVAADALAVRMLADAGITALVLDHGYLSADTYTVDELRARLACPVAPILRLETLAQDLILRHDTFDEVMDAFEAAVAGARGAGYVALKSIIAYRTGLAVRETSAAEAASAFAGVKAQARRDGRLRLACKPLNDHLLLRALDLAARESLPVQIHTGFGDEDVDLLGANPLHLRPLLASERYTRVPFVLLHAGYPYVRELSYLAAVHPNVHMDLGLAVPYLAADIPALFRQALSLAPTSKLLFSTDAYSIPEIFWLAARWGRWGLGVALDELVAVGALGHEEALAIAADILGGNAATLYGLPPPEARAPLR